MFGSQKEEDKDGLQIKSGPKFEISFYSPCVAFV